MIQDQIVNITRKLTKKFHRTYPYLVINKGCSGLYYFPNSSIELMIVRLLHGVGFGMATTETGAIVANHILESQEN